MSNMVGTPLILLFLTHFTTTAVHQKRLHILAAVYFVYELIIVAVFGYTLNASAIAMGPGLLILMAFSLVLFVRHTKLTIIHHHKALGKALLATALLFAYLGYAFIYVFLYLMKTPYKNDTYLVYFFVNTVTSLIMSAGIYFEAKRIQQLEELKITREELKRLYGEEHDIKKAPSKEGAIFKFDNEHWN
jgi:glucan phosphoethanolaminetransferase (alkaline phosphatase superfamily)